jgi:hypothetical protein
VITGLVVAVVIVLVLTFVVITAMDPGPPPGDVALAYEDAWDRFDFESLWALSGDELRDGLGRAAFVRAKREAYRERPELGHIARTLATEEVHAGESFAVVRTRVDLREGGMATNAIQLTKRGGRWVVVGYQLEPEPDSASS